MDRTSYPQETAGMPSGSGSGLLWPEVSPVCQEILELLNRFDTDTVLSVLEKKYFSGAFPASAVYPKYLCLVMLQALQLAFHMKGLQPDELLCAKQTWDRMASFRDAEELNRWLLEILGAVLGRISEADNRAGLKLARDIKTFVSHHLYEIKNVETIAQALNISTSYAQKTFKQQTGITIFDFLFDARMKEARRLLNDPYLRIYEIAEKLGYSSKAYFSRAFQKYCGLTPNEYRKLETPEQDPRWILSE